MTNTSRSEFYEPLAKTPPPAEGRAEKNPATNPATDLAPNMATIPDALPDGPVVLLGTITTPAGTRALIRARGEVLRVTPGDKVGRQTVAAIGDGTLVLVRGARSDVLHIPG